MAREWPVPDNLHVVVRHGRNHNSPVHSPAQGPLRGLCLAKRRENHQIVQPARFQAPQPMKQRRLRLPKRLPKRRAVQRGIEDKVEVKVEVEIQAKTRAPTPVATQFSIRSDEHRDTLRETQGAFRRATAEAVASCGSREAGAGNLKSQTLDPKPESVPQGCNNVVFATLSFRGAGDEESRLSAGQSLPKPTEGAGFLATLGMTVAFCLLTCAPSAP